MANFLNYIVKISIYLLVFLAPLFFLPLTFEAFEYNKQYLLFFFVSLASFAWLAKIVFCDKEIRFRQTPLNFFVLGFLIIAVLSAVFSVDKISSLFGFYGRFSNGLIGLLTLGALYFLIINNVRTKLGEVKEGRPSSPPLTDARENEKGLALSGLIKVFLGSSFLVVLMSYFSVFGVWAKIPNFQLPQVMLQRAFNPVSGSLEGLSIFLAVVVIFLAGLLLVKRGGNVLHWLLLVPTLGLLLIIDFMAAWIIILVTLILFIGFSLWRRIFQEEVNRLLIPIFLIIIAGVFLFFDIAHFHNLNLFREQVLDQTTSWQVGLRGATDSIKSGFLGSGIGTFHSVFAKEKPVEFNETWLWQIRFDRGGSHLAEILGTMGFLGMFSYLALIGIFLMMGYFLLMGIKRVEKTEFSQLPLLLAFVALIVGQLVYYQNATLGFLFWLVLGLSVVSWQKSISEKNISFKNFPELSLVFSTLIIILGMMILTSYFFASKFYLADWRYAKSLEMLGEERIKNLERATELNPHFSHYRVVLARTYLFEVFQEMQKPLDQQDPQKIENQIARSIDQARMANILQPNSVINWEVLGIIYREIRGMAEGAIEWGVASFERAIELEPTNPVLYTELGKLHLAADNLEKARENFDKAIEMKSDYSDALIQQALLLEREDMTDEAIKKLEDLKVVIDPLVDPFYIEVLFQLGRLYFNDNQNDEAVARLQQVISLMPNHSNALYSLGMVYNAKGETQLAIEAFERVLELNPGNQDVIQRLKELKGE